jgi:hypothetical protein
MDQAVWLPEQIHAMIVGEFPERPQPLPACPLPRSTSDPIAAISTPSGFLPS